MDFGNLQTAQRHDPCASQSSKPTVQTQTCDENQRAAVQQQQIRADANSTAAASVHSQHAPSPHLNLGSLLGGFGLSF